MSALAGAEVTLRGPGGFVKIDGSGIIIQGKVTNVNMGGAPGTGILASGTNAQKIELPEDKGR